jgi:hypothetical protein
MWDTILKDSLKFFDGSGVREVFTASLRILELIFVAGWGDYILKVEQEHPDRQIAVLVPELVVRHWSQNLLHNQRAQLLKLLLLLVRGKRDHNLESLRVLTIRIGPQLHATMCPELGCAATASLFDASCKDRQNHSD